MEIMGIDVQGLLLLLLGSVGGMLIGVVASGWGKLEKFVAATENKLDDKALAIFKAGIKEGMERNQTPPAPE